MHRIDNRTGIRMISETKIDDSFPSVQFHIIKSYSPPFKLDCNAYELVILVFVCEDIPCKQIVMKNSFIEGFLIELNLKRKNRLCGVLIFWII